MAGRQRRRRRIRTLEGFDGDSQRASERRSLLVHENGAEVGRVAANWASGRTAGVLRLFPAWPCSNPQKTLAVAAFEACEYGKARTDGSPPTIHEVTQPSSFVRAPVRSLRIFICARTAPPSCLTPAVAPESRPATDILVDACSPRHPGWERPPAHSTTKRPFDALDRARRHTPRPDSTTPPTCLASFP